MDEAALWILKTTTLILAEAAAKPDMFSRILESLAAAGPVALILGLICWKLWEQNQSLMKKIEDQHTKMLLLAVRVQRAVEALAGLTPSEIEKDLTDSKEG